MRITYKEISNNLQIETESEYDKGLGKSQKEPVSREIGSTFALIKYGKYREYNRFGLDGKLFQGYMTRIVNDSQPFQIIAKGSSPFPVGGPRVA